MNPYYSTRTQVQAWQGLIARERNQSAGLLRINLHLRAENEQLKRENEELRQRLEERE